MVFQIIVSLSCEREYTNPWDEKSTLDPSAWAPQNLQITDVSITEKKLTWTYNGDDRFEGFKIDRKVSSGEWQLAYATVGKEIRFWNDSEIIPDPSITYYYRLYAFAGQYNSTLKSTSTSSQIEAPSNLQITPNSITSVTLTWQENINGEEGFKIERKTEGGAWEPLATLAANIVTYQDNSFALNTTIYYRLSAFTGQYTSSFAEKSFNSAIPPPANLNITVNSINSITLTWQDNSNGEEGFKIDRKVNQGTWEPEISILNPNQTSFTENGLDLLNSTYTYRVYAYFQNVTSQKTESSAVSLKCGEPFSDTRDGKQYETIGIGTQCWMKKNLAWLPSVSPPSDGSQSSAYYYVYGYSGSSVTEAKATANYQTYGVLYNWTAALSACPQGWHLPTDAEWTMLTTFLGGEGVAGGKMKEAETTHWNSPNTGATNESGFTGLPGGSRSDYGDFSNIGSNGNWWSSTVLSSTDAWGRYLSYNAGGVGRSYNNKEYGFSVRCLRDE